MPRRNTTRVPSYRLHRPTGQAVVTLAGKDFYLGLHDSAASKAEYDRLVAEWIVNGRHLPPADASSSDLTVNELILAYWRFAETYYRKGGKPTDEQHSIRAALRPLKLLYGCQQVADFGPIALKAVRQWMIRTGHSRKYINDNVNRIKRLFKWGVAEELVAPSVYQALQAVSGLRRGRSEAREPAPVGSVSEQHVYAIQSFVSGQVWAMIQLQWFTGMRPGEVTIMRSCDLDMSGGLWLYRPAAHKTEHHGHKRIIAIGPKAQKVIRPFLKADLTSYLFSPADAEDARNADRRQQRTSPITPSQAKRRPKHARRRAPGQQYTNDSYRYAIVRACDRADAREKKNRGLSPDAERIIPRWHPHQLRHSFATRIRRECGLETARILLGHRSAAVTEVYAELDLAKAADIMARVG